MLTKEDAQLLVDRQNEIIQEYNDRFAEELGKDTYTISDWFRFQEGLMPLVRNSANLVHELHEEGHTEYKVNMQSGIIK